MKNKKRSYLDSVHLYGSIWCIAALFVMLLVPTLMCLHLGVWPDGSVVAKAFFSIAILFYPTAVVEVVAYGPLLGAGGTYLSFLTGNIANLKLPCALSAAVSVRPKPQPLPGSAADNGYDLSGDELPHRRGPVHYIFNGRYAEPPDLEQHILG